MTLPDPPPLEIDPRTLAELRAAGSAHAVLDVREDWEVALAALPDALRVPLGSLAQAEQELPRDRPLVVVCHHGRRSLLATRHLRAKGFAQATNLRGGLDAWALEVDPQMPRY